jgi:hypothetical protein
MLIEGINLPDLTGAGAGTELDQSGTARVPASVGRHDVQASPSVLPALWQSAEALTSPDVIARSEGLSLLVKSNAVRQSPLVAYLVATRLADPDIALRERIVQVLADALVISPPVTPSPDAEGEGDHPVPGEVQRNLINYLEGLRTRQIYAMLQVVEFDAASEPLVSSLLSYCSFAGDHLADILTDRDAPLSMRKQAAYYIGSIGYLDALPALNRLAARLESRCKGRFNLNGASSNPEFGEVPPPDEDDEASLLPIIQNSLQLLNAP